MKKINEIVDSERSERTPGKSKIFSFARRIWKPSENRYGNSRAATLLPIQIVYQSGRAHWIYRILIVSVIGSIGALPFIKIDVSTRASGRARSEGDRLAIQSPVSGLVSFSAAMEHVFVDKNEMLFGIRTDAVDSKIKYLNYISGRNEASLSDASIIIKLLFETRQKVKKWNPDRFTINESRELNQRIGDLLKANDIRSAVYIQNLSDFASNMKARSAVSVNALRELERTKTLGDLSPRLELDARTDALQSALSDLELYIERTIKITESEIADFEQKNQDNLTELKKLDEEKRLYSIHAPAAGILLQVAKCPPGSFVSAGQILAEISSSSEVVIEVLIPPSQVGYIEKGQKVIIAIDAFPHTQWGLLQGKVRTVSGDSISSGETNMFKVIVVPDSIRLNLSNRVGQDLKKGMTVEARFIKYKKSLWSLLIETLSRKLNPNEI